MSNERNQGQNYVYYLYMKNYILYIYMYIYIYENNFKEIHRTVNSGYDWVVGL